jgi:hypothetical protein
MAPLCIGACAEVPRGYATRQQVVEVAALCGVPDFEPTKAGAAWAAYVPDEVADHAAKEDCIYNAMRARDLLVTR